jgi:hypothetical protein
MFWRISARFDGMNVDAKLAELAPLTQKFAKRSSVGTFHNERTNPLHWTQNLYFGVFRTVSLLPESRCKTGRTGAINAQVRSTKWCRNFSQRTHVTHSIGPSVGTFHNERTDPLHWTKNSCFGAFWTVSLLHESRCKTGQTGAINAQVH